MHCRVTQAPKIKKKESKKKLLDSLKKEDKQNIKLAFLKNQKR